MIDKTFTAKHIAFKGDDEVIEKHTILEVTDYERGKIIELAFNVGNVRHYLRFPESELKAALKELKKK